VLRRASGLRTTLRIPWEYDNIGRRFTLHHHGVATTGLVIAGEQDVTATENPCEPPVLVGALREVVHPLERRTGLGDLPEVHFAQKLDEMVYIPCEPIVAQKEASIF